MPGDDSQPLREVLACHFIDARDERGKEGTLGSWWGPDLRRGGAKSSVTRAAEPSGRLVHEVPDCGPEGVVKNLA